MSNGIRNLIGRSMCAFGGSIIGSTITEIIAIGSVDYRAFIAIGVAIAAFFISEYVSPAVLTKNTTKTGGKNDEQH